MDDSDRKIAARSIDPADLTAFEESALKLKSAMIHSGPGSSRRAAGRRRWMAITLQRISGVFE